MTPMLAMKSSTGSSLSVLVVTFLKTSPAFCTFAVAAWLACAAARSTSPSPSSPTADSATAAKITGLDKNIICLEPPQKRVNAYHTALRTDPLFSLDSTPASTLFAPDHSPVFRPSGGRVGFEHHP